jgi:4-amino-4-deoxy-L-arabinose transferase-like glycosyltransferase
MSRWRPVEIAAYGFAVAAIVGLHLATAGNLGFHTDELYYLDAGRHPAFGYVDFPPILPLLARLETSLLGVSPWTLRVLPSVLGGLLVGMSGLYVRRLGGSLWLQVVALLFGIAAPFFLGANWVFQTVTFDQVAWVVALYWFLCVVLEGRPRHWIYLGITLGIGLEVKFTIVGLITGMAVAVLATPSLRPTLRTPYPWFAAGIALVIWLPNLAWQAAEGFPTLAYVFNHSGSGGGPATYWLQIGVYLFFMLPVWIGGLVSMLRSTKLRPIGIACVLPLALFMFGGKAYYAAGTVPIAVAQGIMALSRVKRPRLRRWLQSGAVATAVLEFAAFFFIGVPVIPADQLHAKGLDAINEVFADSVGWRDVALQVQALYVALPDPERESTVIISAYYGVPGALAIYGDPKVLPPVVSPQLSDWYWLPPDLKATDALMIDYVPSEVGWMCSSPQLVAHLVVPYQVAGLEQNAPVTLCRLTGTVASFWPRLKNFS